MKELSCPVYDDYLCAVWEKLQTNNLKLTKITNLRLVLPSYVYLICTLFVVFVVKICIKWLS